MSKNFGNIYGVVFTKCINQFYQNGNNIKYRFLDASEHFHVQQIRSTDKHCKLTV